MKSIYLFLLALSLTFCQNKKKGTTQESYKAKNHDYLKKIAFCKCLSLIDSSLNKQDFSSGIYFEKCSYDPEALYIIDSFVILNKPTFKSFANHKLGVGECISLYESEVLQLQIEKLDTLLANE